jgi:hypothetical protein
MDILGKVARIEGMRNIRSSIPCSSKILFKGNHIIVDSNGSCRTKLNIGLAKCLDVEMLSDRETQEKKSEVMKIE